MSPGEDGGGDASAPDGTITKRELWVLACISLATIVVMCAVAEVGTRWLWPENEHNGCYAQERRPTPGCSTLVKNAEGPWTRMSYNECGYRSLDPCGPKPAGTRRLVVLGSSIAVAMFIPYDQAFSTRVQKILTRQCRFPVQVLNMASISVPFDEIGQLIPEAITHQPDAVLVPLAPYDLGAFAGSAPPTDVGGDVAATSTRLSPLTRFRLLLRDSRAFLVGQHFLFENTDFFVRAYLLARADDALHVPLSPSFRTQYSNVERALAQWGDSLHDHDVPLVVVPVPNRIQAALLSRHERFSGVDPFAFRDHMRQVTTQAGVPMVDVFPAFGAAAHAERMYYPVDSHPNADAHAIIADEVARYLLSGDVPAFASCRSLPDR